MKMRLAFVVLALLIASASPAGSANLTFDPTNVTLTLAAGESGSIQTSAALTNIPPIPFSFTFQLRVFGGSLPTAWLLTPPATMTNTKTSLTVPLTIAVPVSAAGAYTALLQPTVLSSSIPPPPLGMPMVVNLVVVNKCAAAPTIALTSVSPTEFRAPNGRLEDIGVSGKITVPGGCTLVRTWYALVDEYGLNGRSGEITVGMDGSFSFSVPVMVSRRGDDKDGRTYQITVYAQDEAGTGAGVSEIQIKHDQRGGK